jgi:hypothetical protein
MAFHYNRFAASYYAQQFSASDHYNPAWHVEKNDCTNFVSQALLAGGWVMTGGLNHRDYSAWYSSPSFRSWTWNSAEPFAKFLLKSGRAYRCSKDALTIGDLVQLLSENGEAHHTMMVSNLRNGEPLLSYHSVNRTDFLISKVFTLATEQNSMVIFWKVMDFIPPCPPFTQVTTMAGFGSWSRQ